MPSDNSLNCSQWKATANLYATNCIICLKFLESRCYSVAHLLHEILRAALSIVSFS